MSRPEKRIVFLVDDGLGFGHLQCVCKLVRTLQGLFSCLVMTGDRAASWLVPQEAEFVHLPNINSLVERKAKQVGRYPFMISDEERAIAFRRAIIEGTLASFDPDVMIVDWRPLGYGNELERVVRSSRALKYLLLRGVLDAPEQMRRNLLEGPAGEALTACYDRILVAGDRKICDVAGEYNLPPAIAAKVAYIGYVSAPLVEGEREKTRTERGLSEGTPWIVCSVGKGRPGRALIDACHQLSALMPGANFDFIHGPDGSHPCFDGRAANSFVEGNSRYFKECRWLPRLHGSADVVVTHGGYNSLVESMEGGARIVSCYAPPDNSPDYLEKQIHPQELSRFYPMKLISGFQDLPTAVAETTELALREKRPNVREVLNFNGTESVWNVLLADFKMDAVALKRSRRAQFFPGKKDEGESRLQKRLVFYVSDGIGLGHLQRVCRLIRTLQGVFSCLLITGHRAASWFVSEHAEFVHLPHLDNLIESRAHGRGRYPFMTIDREGAIAFRRAIIEATVAAFDPDAILVEHRPLGYENELEGVLRSSRAIKYLMLRGVLETPERTREEFLDGLAGEALTSWYDRILIAADRKVCDVASEYDIPLAIAVKFVYVGYVSTPLKEGERDRVRAERGLTNGEPWIVCSVGRGWTVRPLIDSCHQLATLMPGANFDFIHGPDGLHPCFDGRAANCFVEGNSRYFKECKCLPRLHGSADVVVTHGGYNSLVESMEGGARIVSCYTPRDNSNNNDIEQRMHPERLSRFYPIRVITGVQDMPQAVAEAAEMSLAEDRPRVREVLDFNGAENVQNVLIRDLEVSSNFVKGVTEVKRKVFSNETAVSNDTNGKSRKR